MELEFQRRDNHEEFLTSKNEIFRELLNSKLHGNIVGVTSVRLGNGMFLTAVEDMLLEGDSVTVVLKPYDTTGYFLTTNRILIDDISSIFPFKSKFVNPFMNKLESDSEERKLA
jgi:hypothetical protein